MPVQFEFNGFRMQGSDSPSQNDSDEEQSPLEYARASGLSEEFSVGNPLDTLPMLLSSPGEIASDVLDFTDNENQEYESSLKERLALDKAGCLFLQAVMAPQEPPLCIDQWMESSVRLKRQNLEIPLLQSDNESDMAKFVNMRRLDLSSLRRSYEESVHPELDQGLWWPQDYHNLTQHCMARIEKEKLEVPKYGLTYLKTVVKDDCDSCDELDMLYDELAYNRRPFAKAVSPPLLPFSPPHPRFGPDSSDNLEWVSDLSGLTDAELEVVDRALLTRDGIHRQDLGELHDCSSAAQISLDDIVSVDSPLEPVAAFGVDMAMKKSGENAFRVEEPLLLPLTLAAEPRISMPVELSEMTGEEISDPTYSSSEADRTFFNDVISQIASEERLKLENEQLLAADTKGRAAVPSILPYHPEPPWLGAKSIGMCHLFANQLHTLQRWPGVSKVDRNVSWTAIPLDVGKEAMVETIDDRGYLANILADISYEDEDLSESPVGKPDGWRILDDLILEDDELEPAPIEAGNGINEFNSALRKRRSDLESDSLGEPAKKRSLISPLPARQQNAAAPALTPSRSDNLIVSREPLLPKDQRQGNSRRMAAEKDLTVSSAMSRFLQTRRGLAPVISATMQTIDVVPPAHKSKDPDGHSKQPAGAPSYPPVPLLPKSTPAKPFIVPLSLLTTQRRLFRNIGQRYSNAQFVERDYAVEANGVFRNADILISPSTALVLTTLQKVKQKPLPGQAATAGIRERLAALSTSHERLICLIGEDSNKDCVRDVDHRDCEALAGLSAYATCLEADVQIIYVPGGTSELAAWVVCCMLQHCITFDANLLAEESTWERFLRHCGLNAFAAQILIKHLQSEDAASSLTPLGQRPSINAPPSADALRRFIRMLPQEREERLEQLLGGRRVMRRVSAAIEKRWVSAADGFASLERSGSQPMSLEWEGSDMLM